jgi:glutamyl-Q tRNA(Asp) synthetase
VAWQSRQTAAHAQSLARLVADGHAYACHCSRSELAPFGGIHPARCVGRNHGRRPAWRVRVGAAVVAVDDAIQGPLMQDLAREVGDFVAWRADGACAYQLAVVVDDAELGVTQVVRGADLLDSTPRQVFLQRLLGLPQPAHAHLPLVLDADGRKLSKQDRALPVDAADPLPVLRHALAFLGQPVPRAGTPARLLALAASAFDLARVPRAVPTPFAATRQETS